MNQYVNFITCCKVNSRKQEINSGEAYFRQNELEDGVFRSTIVKTSCITITEAVLFLKSKCRRFIQDQCTIRVIQEVLALWADFPHEKRCSWHYLGAWSFQFRGLAGKKERCGDFWVRCDYWVMKGVFWMFSRNIVASFWSSAWLLKVRNLILFERVSYYWKCIHSHVAQESLLLVLSWLHEYFFLERRYNIRPIWSYIFIGNTISNQWKFKGYLLKLRKKNMW